MIYQRKDSPFLWYKFAINGKLYQGSTKRTSKRDASRYASKLYEEALEASQFGVKPKITIGEALRDAMESASGSTKVNYEHFRRRLLGEGFPHGVLDHSASMETLDKQSIVKLDRQRKVEGLSVNTRNREKAFLRKAYRLADANGYAVTPGLKFSLEKTKGKTRFLTDTEVKVIKEGLEASKSINSDKALYLFLFLLDTGLRLNEAIELRWQRVDIPMRRIYVWRFKGDRPTPVGMTSRVKELLDKAKGQEQPFVSMDRAIKLLRETIDKVCNEDKQICATNGKATIHTIRDTFGSRLVQRNMTLIKVKDLMGHKDIKSTEKYAHLVVNELIDEGVNLLEGSE